jgi:hypothetical protein
LLAGRDVTSGAWILLFSGASSLRSISSQAIHLLVTSSSSRAQTTNGAGATGESHSD